MKDRLLNRTWISPLTSVTFLVVGITGILLAFHVKSGGIKALHEWIGYAFALAGIIHLVINWRAFLAHFRQRSAILAVLAGIVLSLAVLFAGGAGGKSGRANPLLQACDLNGNGIIDADEVSVAATSLGRLDANGDGAITTEELMAGRNGADKGPGKGGNSVQSRQ
jgi:hypothetical protein